MLVRKIKKNVICCLIDTQLLLRTLKKNIGYNMNQLLYKQNIKFDIPVMNNRISRK